MTTPSDIELVPMILPTVMIPLTLISVGFSVVASFIAALFGIQLKLEGPKKLLEVLLKPKVLITGFVLNALIFGGMYGFSYWKNYPRLIRTIEAESKTRAKKSDINYVDVPTPNVMFVSSHLISSVPEKIEQAWRIHTGSGSFRGAIVVNDRVFTGNDLGVVRELDLFTGNEIRSFYIGTPASTEITIWKNSLYVGEGLHDTHHARVYRFDLTSGEFKGSYQTLGHTEGQAVMGSFQGEDTIFVVGGADGLHAVDPITMKGKWKLNIGHMDAGILVDQDRVFFGTGREKSDDKKYKSYAASADFKTGEVLWQRELSASSWMRPVLIGENVCFISGEIYFPSERGHITCFDRKTGAHTISHNTTDPLAATPKVLDNSILYASIHGQVCRFDLKSQRDLWCFDSAGKDFSLAGPSYDSRAHVVLYPSKANGLYILDPSDGKLLMHWQPSKEEGEWKKTYADVTVAGDYWIISDDDGSVRGIRAKFSPQMTKK